MPSIEPFVPVIDSIRDTLPAVQQSIQGAFANFQEDPALSVHIAKDAFERERDEKKEEKQAQKNGQGVPTVSVVMPKVPKEDPKSKPMGFNVPTSTANPILYYLA